MGGVGDREWDPTPGKVWNIHMERGGDGWDRDDGRGGGMLRWFQLSGRGRWADSATNRKISICSTPSPVAATAMLTAAAAQGQVVWYKVFLVFLVSKLVCKG